MELMVLDYFDDQNKVLSVTEVTVAIKKEFGGEKSEDGSYDLPSCFSIRALLDSMVNQNQLVYSANRLSVMRQELVK